MHTGQCSAQAGAGQLQQLQESGLQLAARSLRLLSLSDPKEQQTCAAATSRDDSSSGNSSDMSFITCMAVVRQAANEVCVADTA